MREKHLYEYAVIRYVPRVEREEFLNIGIVVMSKRMHFLEMDFFLDENRIRSFYPETDLDELKKHLEAFKQICLGGKAAGRLGAEDIPERFRWLTAIRSSCIQTSRPHPGFTENVHELTAKLMKLYVQ